MLTITINSNKKYTFKSNFTIRKVALCEQKMKK